MVDQTAQLATPPHRAKPPAASSLNGAASAPHPRVLKGSPRAHLLALSARALGERWAQQQSEQSDGAARALPAPREARRDASGGVAGGTSGVTHAPSN